VPGRIYWRYPAKAPEHMSKEPAKWAVFLNGAAQESNLPSVGLPRLTGFEGLLTYLQLAPEAGFRPRFRPLRYS
jgi:hypothetical protein